MRGLWRRLRGEERRRRAWSEALLQNIQRAVQERRFAFALRHCEELLAKDPRNIQAWLIRGHLAWKYENDTAKAVSCYRQVLILGGYESSNASVAQARASLAQLLAPEP
jgi:Tfp pilus assembly protein PilF